MTESAAKKYLEKIQSWELIDSIKIQKKFEFKNFLEAMEFVNKLAEICEQEKHHADFSVSYNKVTVTIFTHKISGLHENDFILASKIDQI